MRVYSLQFTVYSFIFTLVTGYWLLVTLGYAQDKIPIEITGDKVEYLGIEKKMVAEGSAVVTYEDMKLTADKVSLDVQTNIATAEGNVKLYQDKTIVSGSRLIYNFNTKKGKGFDTDVESDIIFAKGENIEKLSEKEIQTRRGYFTTCSISPPHYRIWAKRFLLYPGDRLVAKNAFFYVGKVPLMYIPQYVYPLNDDRPRVTVIPGKDKAWGFYILSNWRYYFNEGARGIVHFDWREKRDIGWGFDFYYKPQDFGEDWQDINLGSGLLKTYYMHERKINRSHLWDTRKYKLWGPTEVYDATLEKERFRIQWRHEWEMDGYNKAVWEYNQLKDEEFLKDYFYRGEHEKGASSDTYLLFTHTKPSYTLSLLERKRVDRDLSVIELQPEITLAIRNQPIFGVQEIKEDRLFDKGDEESVAIEVDDYKDIYDYAEVYAEDYDREPIKKRIIDPYFESTLTFSSLNSKYAHSELDDDVIKFDAYNQLSFPEKFFYINFDPYVAIKETYFSKDVNGDPITPRAVFYTGTSISTKFFRIFDFDTDLLNLDINDMRHIVTPSINYAFVNDPTIPDSKLLHGGGITRSNTASFSVENKFQTKRQNKTIDILRFITDISYDIDRPSGGRWSDISYDLELIPYPNSRIELDASYDTQDYVFKNLNFDVTAHSATNKYKDTEIFGDDWSYGAGYRYERKGSKQLTTEVGYRLNPKWKFKVYERFELARGKYLREQEYTIIRDLHCWALQITYNVTREYGESIWIAFKLKAFPEMGIEFDNSYHQPKFTSQSITFEER